MLHELQQSINIDISANCLFPEARAVIEGNNPGWVFVDDQKKPSAALIWAQGIEGFYLIGDRNCTVFHSELDVFTEQVLRPRLFDIGIIWFEISGSENWNPVIEKVFEKRKLESSQQLVYTIKSINHKPLIQRRGSGNCMLKKVDQQLLIDLSVVSKGFLFSKLTQFWDSVGEFLKAGLGYALLDEEEIVSLCFSAFVVENTHVIDIETIDSHRRKGYAERAAQAFVADCIEMQLQPHWDCMAENIASAQLAKKLGFRLSHEYTLYSFPLQQ